MLSTITSTQGTQGNSKKEVDRLVLLGVLKVENDSEWGAP